jgi:hypothetical protein
LGNPLQGSTSFRWKKAPRSEISQQVILILYLFGRCNILWKQKTAKAIFITSSIARFYMNGHAGIRIPVFNIFWKFLPLSNENQPRFDSSGNIFNFTVAEGMIFIGISG